MSDRLPPVCGAFTVEVKRKHYREALPGSSHQCVIAVALRAAFPDLERVTVQAASASISYNHWLHDGSFLVWAFDNHKVDADNAPLVTPVRFTRH